MANVVTAATFAALKSVSVPPTDTVYEVVDRSSVGDGGGGLFRWDVNSTELDNDGTILKPNSVVHPAPGRWIRLYEGPLDIRWFGAVGDDSTDNRTTIQNAINVAAGGGAVYVPPDMVFRVRGCLKLLSDLTILGEPGRSRLHFIRITSTGGNPNDTAFWVDGITSAKSKMVLRDLVIYSDNIPVSTSGNPVMRWGVTISGVDDDPAADDLTIEGCEFYYLEVGALACNGEGLNKRLRFERNYVHDMGTSTMASAVVSTGINPDRCDDSIIAENTFRNVGVKDGDWALYVTHPAKYLRFVANSIEDCRGGVKLSIESEETRDFEEVVIAANVFRGFTNNAITTDSYAANYRVKHLTVVANVLDVTTQDTDIVMLFRCLENSVVANNTFDTAESTTHAAIGLQGLCHSVEVSGNNIRGKAGIAGIYLNGPVGAILKDISVTNNDIRIISPSNGIGIFIDQGAEEAPAGVIERPRLFGNRVICEGTGIAVRVNTAAVTPGAANEGLPELEIFDNFLQTEGTVALWVTGSEARKPWVHHNRCAKGRISYSGYEGIWEDNLVSSITLVGTDTASQTRLRRNSTYGTELSNPLPKITTGSSPSLYGSENWLFEYGSATNVTNFTGTFDGEVRRFIATNGNATVIHNATRIKLAGAANFAMTADDTLTLLQYGGIWYELDRSVN